MPKLNRKPFLMLQICEKFYDNEGTYKPMQLNLARTRMEEKIFEKKLYSISIVLE